MLARLVLRDFVLAKHVEVQWDAGFCVVSGETGAGKSLLVGALALLRGGRVGNQKVRPGASRAEVEAEFVLAAKSPAAQWLREQDLELEEEDEESRGGITLMIRRVLRADKSSAYINGRQVPNARLQEVVAPLMDICGQHAYTALQQVANHRRWLDDFANNESERAAVAAAAAAWEAASAQLDELRASLSEQAATRAHLQAVVDDFAGFEFSAAQWQEMNEIHTRTTHVSDLLQHSAHLQNLLDGSSESISSSGDNVESLLLDAQRTLTAMQRNDASLSEMNTTLSDVLSVVRDVARDINDYAARLIIHPEAQATAEAFIAESHRLARKYQLSDPLLLEDFITENRRALEAVQNAASDEQLAQQVRECYETLATACEVLSANRAAAAQKLSAAVNELLKQLGMAKATFSVQLEPLDTPTAMGAEQARLCIQTRPNMPADSIAKIASGGELSRLNLALQLVSKHASPVSIFDEVDAGISGATADIIGQLLNQLAEQKQVICITHLPQVAAHATAHWRVGAADKTEDEMQVQPLTREDRIEELARLQSGSQITPTARAHAESLLASSHAK